MTLCILRLSTQYNNIVGKSDKSKKGQKLKAKLRESLEIKCVKVREPRNNTLAFLKTTYYRTLEVTKYLIAVPMN